MASSSSYQPNYFSIEDIIATQTTVACKLTMRMPRLGELDPSIQNEHLLAGKKLDLPAWMAFALHRRRLITCDMSKPYNRNFREILKAEPGVVDLMRQEPFFYETGRQLGALVREGEEEELKTCLLQTFQMRSKNIISLVGAPRSAQLAAQEQLLSREEGHIMLRGRERYLEVYGWLTGTSGSGEVASAAVTAYRKRKRQDLEGDG